MREEFSERQSLSAPVAAKPAVSQAKSPLPRPSDCYVSVATRVFGKAMEEYLQKRLLQEIKHAVKKLAKDPGMMFSDAEAKTTTR